MKNKKEDVVSYYLLRTGVVLVFVSLIIFSYNLGVIGIQKTILYQEYINSNVIHYEKINLDKNIEGKINVPIKRYKTLQIDINGFCRGSGYDYGIETSKDYNDLAIHYECFYNEGGR